MLDFKELVALDVKLDARINSFLRNNLNGYKLYIVTPWNYIHLKNITTLNQNNVLIFSPNLFNLSDALLPYKMLRILPDLYDRNSIKTMI